MAAIPISFVIPAFNAAATVGAALDSIAAGAPALAPSGKPEVIVVDDGSDDGERLDAVLAGYPAVRLLRHARNRGMCAARNSGIFASRGAVVAILDADDVLVADWPQAFRALLEEWPEDAGVCFSACRDGAGRATVARPDYGGPLTLDDALNERLTGEYLPLFRGHYIRARGYVDLGLKRSCGTVSYLTFLGDGPFHASPRTLRIYHAGRAGSVSDLADPAKAAEAARCAEAVLARFGALYAARAPAVYAGKRLRHAVYLRRAGEPGAFRVWARALGWHAPVAAAGALAMMLLGGAAFARALRLAKALGLVKRYG
jgi:glycosyltransferase involved in cell wall biosynthesis